MDWGAKKLSPDGNSMNLTLTLEGHESLADALKKAAENLSDMSPCMVLIGRYLQTATARRWRLGVSPDGVPWKPTGRLAMMARPGGGGGGRTLWSAGILFRSVTSRVPTTGQIFRTDKTSAVIGTNVPYGHVHQKGMKIFPKNAKRLAVPMNRAAALAGGAKNWWTQQKLAGRKPFIGGGGKFIGLAGPRATTLHFALFKSVTIPKRPFLGIATEDHKPLVNLVLAHAFGKGLRNAGL